MKRVLWTIVCFVLLFTWQTRAQNTPQEQPVRHYISLSLGDNLFNGLMGGYTEIGCCYEPPSIVWFGPDVYRHTNVTLPTFSLSYYYAFKPWLLVGAEAYYSGSYSPVYEKPQMQKVGMASTTAISILPSVRFQYFNRRYCSLYSGISLGLFLAINQGNHHFTGNSQDALSAFVMPSYQLTAFGVRFGDRIYGTAEIGCGVKGIATIGIGTRF